MRRLLFVIGLIAVVTGATGPAAAQLAVQVTHMGFRCNEDAGGALYTVWTTGNLGNTWNEGEWVPYQVLITGIQSVYPDFAGLPDIVISFDFTDRGNRCVDLIRAVQVGTMELTDTEGFPDNMGGPLPLATREQLEIAQNYLGEWEWQLGGGGDFTFLNLPEAQIMRDETFGEGTPTDERKFIKITPVDLINAGISISSDTVVVYYQLHESRTLVWTNSLQSIYDQFPTDAWGGYLYSLPAYAGDMRNGSGYVSGSSLHAAVMFVGEKTIPIPIPPEPEGVISGMKWDDADGDGLVGPAEDMLSGWRIHIVGAVDGLGLLLSTVTGTGGTYSFSELTHSAVWTVKEDADRYDPHEIGYDQTYPTPGIVLGQATAVAVTSPPAGVSEVGWHVNLTFDLPQQGNLGFGNTCFPSSGEPTTWSKIKAEFGEAQ